MNNNRFYDYNDNNKRKIYSDNPQSGHPVVSSYNRYPEGSNEVYRSNGVNYYSGGQFNGNNKRPKKKKSQFLTKKAAAIVLALCVGSAATFGFTAGMLTGQENTNTAYANIPEAVQTSADVSGTTDLSVAEIAARTQDSIVEIQTSVTQTNQFNQEVSGEAAGSGIIISEDGYIVTNNHVVENGTKFTVGLKNGESYDATLIGRDPQMDLAVLKIDATGLTPVTFGNSGKLSVGDTTVAIGNPLGTLGGTVTNGIVSATNRTIDLGNGSMNLIQTNAAINPGNSGGGLFNGQGELIGVVVAKSGGSNIEGLGYAIPVNEARTVIDQLMDHGYVKGRLTLGMAVTDITSDQTAMMYGLSSSGVYIVQVEDNSQAANMGIKAGDRIVSLDNKTIESSSDLQSVLDQHSAGDKVEITIERSGQTGSTEITLQEYVPSTM